MLEITRGPDQTNPLIDMRDEAEEELAGVFANGRYFGDASLMTGIAFPRGIVEDDEGARTTNAAKIQAAIDAAGPGTTIRLPNFRFYCDQLNIPPGKPGIIIEGGGQTLIINRTSDFPNNNYVVFKGFADRIADAVGMHEYWPGEPNQNSFIAYNIGGGHPHNFDAPDVMYVSIPIYQQTLDDVRTAKMIEVASVQDNQDGTATVTLAEDLPIDLGAAEAVATVSGGAVTEITITNSHGVGYYSVYYNGQIRQPRVKIDPPSGGGTTATAKIKLNAPIHEFLIVNPGLGYQTAPEVVITPANGASATAQIDPVTGKVINIFIGLLGSGFEESPTVTLATDGSPTEEAEVVATIGPSLIADFDITDGGTNYSPSSPPAVTIDAPLFQAKYVRGGTKVSSISRQTVTLDPEGRATKENYPIGSVVWLCNGPTFTDADGQYFRALAVPGGGVIELDRTVRTEDFRAGLTCLVPGPFIERLTFRNLQIGGLGTLGFNSILLSGAYDVKLDNVQMVPGDDDLKPDHFYFTKTQFVRIRNYEGLVTWQTSHNCSIQDSQLTGLVTHSNAKDFTFQRCIIGGPLRLWYFSERFTFRDCAFTQSGTGPNPQDQDVFYASEASSRIHGWIVMNFLEVQSWMCGILSKQPIGFSRLFANLERKRRQQLAKPLRGLRIHSCSGINSSVRPARNSAIASFAKPDSWLAVRSIWRSNSASSAISSSNQVASRSCFGSGSLAASENARCNCSVMRDRLQRIVT
jgi:hypothetical protein